MSTRDTLALARVWWWMTRIILRPFIVLWCLCRDVALYVFAPRDRFGVSDGAVQRLWLAQQTLAPLLYFGSFLIWSPGSFAAGEMLESLFSNLFEAVFVAAVCIAPAWLIVTACSSERRLRSSAHALLPFGVAIIGLGIVVALMGLFWLVNSHPARSNADSLGELLAKLYLAGAALAITSSFLWYGLRTAASGYFRAVDGHPFMRPITLVIVAIYLVISGVWDLNAQGTDVRFPMAVALGFVFLAPTALCALGILELVALHRSGLRISQYFRPLGRVFQQPPDVKPWVLGGTPLFPSNSAGAPGGPRIVSGGVLSPQAWVVGVLAVLAVSIGVTLRQASPLVGSNDVPASVDTSTPKNGSLTPESTYGSLPTSGEDLQLAQPIATPACDGRFVLIVASAVNPENYAMDVQAALTASSGSNYLRTDQSCSSLRSQYEGNPIYVVYNGPFDTVEQACQAKFFVRGDSYVKRLDMQTPPDDVVRC